MRPTLRAARQIALPLLLLALGALAATAAGQDRRTDAPPPIDPALAKAFAGFTPGRQREFANHVGDAKREATRLSRLEKIKPMIMDGVGLNDRYRNC